MRQAIVTKWLGPTNHRGSRVKATASAGSVAVGWDYSQGVEANHKRAAEALATRFGWSGLWIGGAIPNASGFVFVHDVGQPEDQFKVAKRENG